MHRRIAYDIGPLIGPRSGIGVAVDELLGALRALDDPPEIQPYVLSFRADLPPGTVRLRAPAALAVRAWTHSSFPPVDRTLGRPDVVHGTNYVVPPSRAARLVSVYDCWFLRHPDGVHRDVARAGAALRRALTTGAVAHCSSQATADALVDLVPGARTEVVHLGHVPLPSPPGHPSATLAPLVGRPYVVALGTMERRKNLPTLVRAFAAAALETPDLDLVIAGGPANDSEAVTDAVTALPIGIARRIHVLGRVDDADKSWLVHHARLLAYPSLDEGFGFPILEAMGAGTPVVASAVGSIPEVAGDAALLVEPSASDDLAAAIVALHLDEGLRRRLLDRGRANVARFTWRTTAERMRALYDALAMERPR